MWGALIPAVISGLAGLFGAKQAGNANKAQLQASQPLINMQTQLAQQQYNRVQQADPVYQALVQMAYKRMPTYARQGVTAPSFGTPTTGGGTLGRRPNEGNPKIGRAAERY